jgi:ferredoxin-NADP reductase
VTRAAPAELDVEVRVHAKTACADGVVSLDLRRVDSRAMPAWTPGAHVDLLIDDVATRQYSLCGDPRDRERWRIGVLRDPDGHGSSLYIHDVLRAGDVLHVRGPRNHFELVASHRYLFIAGGIGITPLLPMVAAAHEAGADWRLIYGGRRRRSMAFVDELAVYGTRVEIHPQDEAGLLDLDTLLARPDDATRIYCCGPEPLLAAVEQRAVRWPAHALHTERFTPKPVAPPVRADAIEVVLAQSGATLLVGPDQSILQAVQAAGVPVPCSCTEGICGTCETQVLEGIPDHRDSILTDDDRAANDCMMICVSRSLTQRLVLDL